MTDFIQIFIEEMGKTVIRLTCIGMVNILKYIPGFQGVDETPYSLALIPDELQMQKMCEKFVEKYPWELYYVPDNFGTQEMCELKMNQKP